MYFSFAVVSALLATSVSALTLSLERRQYPDCANSCLVNVDYHGCNPSSVTCLCNNSDYVKETTACIVDHCSGDDLQQALNVAESVCESVGITLQSSSVLPSTFLDSASGSATSTSVSATTTSTKPSSSASSSSDSNGALNLQGFSLTGIVAGALVALLL